MNLEKILNELNKQKNSIQDFRNFSQRNILDALTILNDFIEHTDKLHVEHVKDIEKINQLLCAVLNNLIGYYEPISIHNESFKQAMQINQAQ